MVQRVIVETEEQLALRNQQRLEQAKRTLGGRYVLHPSNQVIHNVKRDRARWPSVWLCRTNCTNQSREIRPSASL